MRTVRVACLSVVMIFVTAACETTPRAKPIDGSIANDLCPNFKLDFGIADVDIEDPGWVFVNTSQKFSSVIGTAVESHISNTEFPASHDSHDQNTIIAVDRGQEDILSDSNYPNNEDDVDSVSNLQAATGIEMEWETGTRPSEIGAGAPERTFPRWAWPSIGDRVWADGAWIFDCGHTKKVGGVLHRRTEIHPARAIASMRDQVVSMPGVGPTVVTAIDLYIHGHAGAVTDILECGPAALIGQGTCNIAPEPHRGLPIDEDFKFEATLPTKFTNESNLVTLVQDGPGNTIDVDPILRQVGSRLEVTIPLAGSGAQPEDVYARKIYAGWTETQPQRRFRVTVTKIDLHEDRDSLDDCECTFFWVNLDKASNEWYRLVDFENPTDDGYSFGCPDHTNTMNDWDDDHACGNGELRFTGPSWDFRVTVRQSFTIRARGYDQDCADDLFGDHVFRKTPLVACWVGGTKDDDDFNELAQTFRSPDYGVGTSVKIPNPGGQFDLYVTIQELPL